MISQGQQAASSDENPYLSPGAVQGALKDRYHGQPSGTWQISLVVVLTFLLSGLFLFEAIVNLIAAISLRSTDGVYVTSVQIDDLVFTGPDQIRKLTYWIMAAATCLLVLAGVTFVAAVGLKNRRKWGCRLAIGLALLLLLPVYFVFTDFAPLLIPLGTYSVIVLLVLLQQKNRLQFQHGRAYAE